jgi:hypothetical protein
VQFATLVDSTNPPANGTVLRSTAVVQSGAAGASGVSTAADVAVLQ